MNTAGNEGYLNRVTLGGAAELNGKIHLAEYDAKWPLIYEREAERIRAALGDRILLLEHVGSTAVPGLCAKPVIDVLLVVEDSAAEGKYIPCLEAAGYALRIREPDWYAHRMLRGEDPALNLHVFSSGCEDAQRMLAFRNRLRQSPADRQLYAEVKRKLAAQEWKYVQDYADAKANTVGRIMSRALEGSEVYDA